jgi:hypothetical protein
MAGAPKRHHQVPNFYLQRFAVGNLVRVRWRDGKAVETSPINVAVESGFYSVPDGVVGGSTAVEDVLALSEGAAASVIAGIDRSGALPAVGSRGRADLAVFLALQMSRTTERREQVMFPERVAKWLGERELTQELMSEYLEKEHLGSPPRRQEAEGAYIYVCQALEDGAASPTFAIRVMLRVVQELAPMLLARHWSLEIDPTGRIITSDTPVVVWRKHSNKDEHQGLGIAEAEELRFPLDPGKQLVLSKRTRKREIQIAAHRVRHCNADMADGCHRFVVGSPAQPKEIDGARLDSWRPVIRSNVGPLVVEQSDGSKDRDSEVLHVWVPRRPIQRR